MTLFKRDQSVHYKMIFTPAGRCPAAPGSFVLLSLRGTLPVQYALRRAFTISLIDTVAACEAVISGHEFSCG